jgi:hypothetical protein
VSVAFNREHANSGASPQFLARGKTGAECCAGWGMAMAIIGLNRNMTLDEFDFEIQRGAKFVRFYYCISALVITMRRFSQVYYIKPEESVLAKSLPYTLVSLVAGWWGIPWGPIYTVQSVYENCTGGEEVTGQIRSAVVKATQTRSMAAATGKS